ncbi:MAG TPA: CAP domain-containing protein [Thermomicrobiales bacterium]|nr:CAP domain-containing protein [Thermomicrobiales bacterium]
MDGNEAACFNATESEVLRLLNVERQAAGLAPLSNSRKLNVASYCHSLDMATNGFFSRTDSDGSSPVQRIRAAGYTGWTAVAENIAVGYPSVAAVVNGWMNSSGHRANILNGSLTQVGIGLFETSSGYGLYWSTDFGNASDPGC